MGDRSGGGSGLRELHFRPAVQNLFNDLTCGLEAKARHAGILHQNRVTFHGDVKVWRVLAGKADTAVYNAVFGLLAVYVGVENARLYFFFFQVIFMIGFSPLSRPLRACAPPRTCRLRHFEESCNTLIRLSNLKP